MKWSHVLALSLLALPFWACRQEGGVHREEIERLSRQIGRHAEEQQWSELVTAFADTAILASPGGYRVRGRDVLQAHFKRYFLTREFVWETRGLSDTNEALSGSDDWPAAFRQLPAEFPLTPPEGSLMLYQWADWTVRFEGEDGVIRQEAFPVLLVWKRQPEHGWQVVYLFQG